MNVIKNYNGKELTMAVDGRIDTISAIELEEEINTEMGNFDSLIMDLGNLEYISSAGLRILIATQKKLKSEDIPFVIRNVNDAVKEIFKMSGFIKILNIE